jgi:hypothetical protein
MTKAQAWERFGEAGILSVYMGPRTSATSVREFWCGYSGRPPEGVVQIGTGPSPEAAIAAAFGETLTPTCGDCDYHDVTCHCQGLDDCDTTHRERYCPRSATGLDASECRGFNPLLP